MSWWCKNSKYNSYDAIICDGAVRSGKTLCMSLSFVFWAMGTFKEHSFAICGKTITSLKRNIILPLSARLNAIGFDCDLHHSQNYLEVSANGVVNRFYFFGGKDESSASLIQGMTLSGVLLDEVALMPRSFVEQTLARCSVEGSRFWFNCNPSHPHHWFYTEWIKKRRQKNALYLHFEMEDNPSLTPGILSRYKSLYSGTFYDRFVRGLWVAAEGLVYPDFDPNRDVCDAPEVQCSRYYISCDYGTVNPMSMGLWGLYDGCWYRLKEYYYSSKQHGQQKTDEEYYAALEELAGDREITAVICDPSAASFMETVRRHGVFRVIPAKNNVADGIRKVANTLKQKKIRITKDCADAIREFSLYRWDEGSVNDRPVKENDHAMDDIRYFAATVLDRDTDDFFVVAAQRF